MNLTFHHFKKDVRQFRLLLTIWFVLLLIDFAVNNGWVGNVEYSPSKGFENGSDLWTELLPVVIWAFAGILPSLVVLADSPARHEGFLATRPVRKREVLVAKILFVLVLIVLPWTLSEALYLANQRLPEWVIAQGLSERLLILLPVTFGAAAFAALWPGTAKWARALGIGSACFLISGGLYSYCFEVLKLAWLPSLNLARGFGAPYIMVVALIFFAAWHARGHRSWKFRWSGIIGCMLVGWIGGSLVKLDFVRLRPGNPTLASAVVAGAEYKIPTPGIQPVSESNSRQSNQKKFTVFLLPETKLLSNSEVIQWSGIKSRLVRTNGSEIPGARQSAPSPIFVEHYGYEQIQFQDAYAWAASFPKNVMFRQMQFGGFFYGGVAFDGFRFPDTASSLSEPLQMKAELDARVFQWRKIADLPLTAGAIATNEFGSWEIKSTQSLLGMQAAQLFLERRQIELMTATNSRCSSANGGPLNRMQLMVYDPQDQVAMISDSYAMNAGTRAKHTGYVRHFVEISFNGRGPFTADELARFRLVIFEKVWVGSAPQQWESAAFTLSSKLGGSSGDANFGNRDSLSRGELQRRLAALNTPPVNAPRREISLYLLEYFRLLDAYGRTIDSGGPEVAKLATFVPTQLDSLLQGLPAMGWISKSVVLNAICAGALEEQKSAVIAALHSQFDLAEVLMKRGWTGDARAELYAVIQSHNNVPFSLFQAVALFHDPQTYPSLLDAFETHPSEGADDLLHRLGLGEPAGEIIHRKWIRNTLIWAPGMQMFDETFRLALRHGDTSALQRAFLVAKLIKNDDTNEQVGLIEGIWQSVQIPELMQNGRPYDSDIAAWMKKHSPEDFVFSPVRRQFVLKPATNSVATAASATPRP